MCHRSALLITHRRMSFRFQKLGRAPSSSIVCVTPYGRRITADGPSRPTSTGFAGTSSSTTRSTRRRWVRRKSPGFYHGWRTRAVSVRRLRIRRCPPVCAGPQVSECCHGVGMAVCVSGGADLWRFAVRPPVAVSPARVRGAEGGGRGGPQGRHHQASRSAHDEALVPLICSPMVTTFEPSRNCSVTRTWRPR